MEKLFELHQEGRYDLLVLDTPPSRNALDFLDAPRAADPVHRGPRAAGVHEADRLRRRRVVGRGTSMVFSVLKRVTGVDLLAGPVRVLPGLQRHGRRLPRARQAGQRAARRPADLASWSSAARRASRSSEAVYFHRKLVEARAAVRRRDRQQGPLRRASRATPATGARASSAEALGDADLAERVAANFADYQALAERDARNIERLARELRRAARDPRSPTWTRTSTTSTG